MQEEKTLCFLGLERGYSQNSLSQHIRLLRSLISHFCFHLHMSITNPVVHAPHKLFCKHIMHCYASRHRRIRPFYGKVIIGHSVSVMQFGYATLYMHATSRMCVIYNENTIVYNCIYMYIMEMHMALCMQPPPPTAFPCQSDRSLFALGHVV